MNSPVIRDRAWLAKVNKYTAQASKRFWNIQAQWDFGLGSVFGENNMVTDVWNPFLHYFNNEQTFTIGYDPPIEEANVVHSSRAERLKWSIEMHKWDFYKPPEVLFQGEVHKGYNFSHVQPSPGPSPSPAPARFGGGSSRGGGGARSQPYRWSRGVGPRQSRGVGRRGRRPSRG